MIRFTRIGTVVAVGALLSLATSAQAETVLDFEGIAPVRSLTTENGIRSMHGFDVGMVHGHYMDAAYVSSVDGYVSNGTDYIFHDTSNYLTVAKGDAGTFSIASFDATEWHSGYAGMQQITATGFLQGGGSVSTVFTTAARAFNATPTFQTFNFDGSWTNLTAVTFRQSSYAVYDNIRLDVAAAPVPLPAAAWGGMALFGLIGAKRLRRRASTAV